MVRLLTTRKFWKGDVPSYPALSFHINSPWVLRTLTLYKTIFLTIILCLVS